MNFPKIFLIIFFGFLILTLPNHPAEAKVYKYKDENGKIHFTDSLNKIPFKYRPKKRKAFRINNCHKPISKDIKVLLEKLGNKIAESKVNLKKDYETQSKMRKTSLRYYRFSQLTLEYEIWIKENEVELNKFINKYECNTESYSLN